MTYEEPSVLAANIVQTAKALKLLLKKFNNAVECDEFF